MNKLGRLLARLVLLLLAGPALLLGVAWGAAVIVDFHQLNWTQRLVLGGITLGAFAVLGGCIYGFMRIGAKAAAEASEAELDRTVAAVQVMDRLEARIKHWVVLPIAFLSMLICFALAIFGWVDGNALILVAMLVIGLLFAAVGFEHIRLALMSGPFLAIDRNGLQHAIYGAIRWRELTGFRLHTIHTHGRPANILRLGVKYPHQYLARAGWVTRLSHLGILRKKPGQGVLDIPLSILSVEPLEIMTMMERMRREVAPDLLQHWHESFRSEQLEAMSVMQQFSVDVEAFGDNPSEQQMQALTGKLETNLPAIEAASRSIADDAKHQLRKMRWTTWGLVALLTLYVVFKFGALFGLFGTGK